MSRDGQLERLCAVYGEKSDEELLGMYDDRDDLTEVAQQALADTMRGRNLVGRAVAHVDDAAEDGEAESLDIGVSEAALYTFSDAFEAREAIRVLDEAGVWQRVAAFDEEAPKDGRPLGLTLIVRKSEYRAALDVLRTKLGLFPKPEAGDGLGSPLTELQEMVMVSMFDRSEGLAAAEALGRAGISYCWRDGQDEMQELPDAGTVAIEVRRENLATATNVVEKALAALPEA